MKMTLEENQTKPKQNLNKTKQKQSNNIII